MEIPETVLAAARESLDHEIVRNFLRSVCRAHGVDPGRAPAYYTGTPLFVYRTLFAANEFARAGERWRSPYLDPADTMLGELLEGDLSASERMQVRVAPAHLRMEVAKGLLARDDLPAPERS